MVVFAGVQVWLMHAQNRQQVRIKRLELANELTSCCVHYPYTEENAKEMLDWLVANRAKFTFLLRKKDTSYYWNLCDYIFDLQQQKPYLIGDTLEFATKVADLFIVLCGAKYDIAKYRIDRQRGQKNAKK